jgi:hypothetical protein
LVARETIVQAQIFNEAVEPMTPPVVPCWLVLWKRAARPVVEPSVSGSTAFLSGFEPSTWPPGTLGDGPEHGGRVRKDVASRRLQLQSGFFLSATVSRGPTAEALSTAC